MHAAAAVTFSFSLFAILLLIIFITTLRYAAALRYFDAFAIDAIIADDTLMVITLPLPLRDFRH